jgi:pimeloyl-ACP methyl ester carboxylesterase
MIDAMGLQWIISVPTLFIYGEKSGYITENDMLTIEETFTESRFVMIPDAGHWVHAEQPNAFYNVVLDFLA